MRFRLKAKVLTGRCDNKRDYSFGIGSDADDPEFLERSRNRE